MKVTIHDPGHVVLRRGIRAGIGVPVASLIALLLLPHSPAGIVASYGAFCLIAVCDFGGSPARRLSLYLWATLAGAVVVVLGILASQALAAAVVVTFIVGAFLAFTPMLRGAFTSGSMAMLIMYVLSVTTGLPLADIGKCMIAWLIAVVVSVIVATVLLPRPDLSPVRRACAGAMEALGKAVQARGASEPLDPDDLAAAQDALRHSYLGNPFRAAGLNSKDRALIALAGQVQGLLSSFATGRAYPTPIEQDEATVRLNALSAQALLGSASALESSAAAAPTGVPIAEEWLRQWDVAVDTLADPNSGDAEQRVERVAGQFPDRLVAVAVVRSTMLARRVLGLGEETYPHGPHTPQIPAPVVSAGREDLRAHLTFRSPWARLALRTGIGLALAVIVVAALGLAHGLWVVLGVTAALRFDSRTTLKSALLAVVGTFVGAGIGYILLRIDTTQVGFIWVVFVVVTFLAVFLTGAVGFASGQAAFSLFVIVAFTVMTWPPDLATAGDRLEDVAVGVIVSIVVALLMWPKGIMQGALRNVSEAIRSSADLVAAGGRSLVTGQRGDDALLVSNSRAMARAMEVVELTAASPNKGAAAAAFSWEALLDHLRTPAAVGRLLTSWGPNHSPITEAGPGAAALFDEELDAAVRQWRTIADEIDSGQATTDSQQPVELGAMVAATAAAPLTDPEVADRAVAALWGFAWLQFAQRAGEACEVPGVQA